MDILFSILGALGVGGIISGTVLAYLRKIDKKQELREEARIKESILLLEGLQATGHLSEAVAIAQKNGKTNGETETALKYYQAFKDKKNAFLLEQSATKNHSRHY